MTDYQQPNYATMSDDDLDAQVSAADSTSGLQAQTPKYDYNTSDDALDARVDAAAEDPSAAPSNVAPKQFNLYGGVAEYYSTTTDYMMHTFEYNKHDIVNGFNWLAVRTGQMKEEEALEKQDDKYWADYKKQNLDPMEQAPWFSTIPQRVLGATSGFMPYATAVLGTGAAGGFTMAAPFGAPGGLPGMGAAGLVGIPGGIFTTGSLFGSARMYGQLRAKGLSPERASQYADNWGMFEGAANVLKGGLIKGMGGAAVDQIVKQEAVKRSFMQGVHHLLSKSMDMVPTLAGDVVGMTEINVAQFVSENLLNNLADISKKYDSEFFQTVSNLPAIRDKFIEMVLSTEFWEGLGKTVQNSIYAGVGVGMGARAIGATTGHIIKASGGKEKSLYTKALDAALADLKREIDEKNQPAIVKDLLKSGVELKVDKPKVTKAWREKVNDFIKDADAKIDDLENLRDETERQGENVDQVNQLLKEARAERRQLVKDKRKAEYEFAADEIDNIIELAASKFVIEKDETPHQETKRLQSLITKLINKSGLSPENRADFLSLIKDVQKTEHLVGTAKTEGVGPKIKKRIAEKLEGQAVKEANKQLDKQLKRTIPYEKGKIGDAKFDFVWNEILTKYRNLITQARTVKENVENDAHRIIREGLVRRDALAQAMHEGKPLPETNLAKETEYAIATDVVNIKNADSKYVEALTEKLETIIDFRRDEKLSRQKAKKEKEVQLWQSVVDSLNGTKPIRTKELDPKTGKVVTKIRRFSQAERSFSKFGENFRGWKPFWRALFRDAQNPELATALVDLHEQVNKESKDLREWKQKAGEMVMDGSAELGKILVDIEQNQFTKEDPRIHDLAHEFYDADGKPTLFANVFKADKVVSTGVLMQLYLMMKNKRRDAGLGWGMNLTFKDPTRNPGGNKVIRSAEEALNNLLTPQEKQIAENTGKFYNESDFSHLIEENVKAEFDMPMAKHDFYDGPSIREGFDKGDEASLLDTHRQLRDRTSLPANLIETKDSKLPYDIKPIVHTLKNYINRNVSWMAFREVYPGLYRIVHSKTVKEIVTAKNSPETIPIMQELFGQIVGTRGQQLLTRDALLAHFRKGTAMMLTGGKLVNAVAQLSSIINYLATPGINPVNFSTGLMKVMRDPLATMKLLRETDYLKNRADEMVQEYKEGRAARPLKDFATGKGSAGEFFQYFIRNFDRWSHFIGGGAVYHAIKDAHIEKGMTPEAAHTKAVAIFERASAEFQGSVAKDWTTYAEYKGETYKWFGLFGKQITQVFQNQLIGLQAAMANPNLSSLANVAKIYAAAHMAQATFDGVRYSSDLQSDDVEKRSLAELRIAMDLFNPAQVPILGDFIFNNAVITWNELMLRPAGIKPLKTYDLKFMPYDQANYVSKAYGLSLRFGIDQDKFSLPDTFAWLNAMARGVGPAVGGKAQGVPLPAFITGLKQSLGIEYKNGKMVMPEKKEGQDK